MTDRVAPGMAVPATDRMRWRDGMIAAS